MNTEPTTPHLDLEELIAEVNGQPVADRAREHLASCAHCQLEANRWNLVADAVLGLAADTPEAPQPARPLDTRPRRRRRPVRYALLGVGSAAAALALFVGIGSAAGIVSVSFGSGGGQASGGHQTTLTAVTGCSLLEQASGTLERVNGADVVVKGANGQLVTVTTTAATKFAVVGTQLGDDITDGASVGATGPRTDGTISAISVLIGDALAHSQPPPGMVHVQGTVSDASAAGFTIVTSDGAQVPVAISGNTVVSVANASLGQLPVGASVHAIGFAGPDGTLAARGVAAILQLPPNAQVHISVKDCSTSSINHEILALAGD
jgi:hypothetical protein